jgi:cell division protein FtsB
MKQMQIRELSKQSSLLDKQISQLSNKIVKMKRDIKIAKTDPHVIEHKAKDDLMMVNKNESIIIFNDGKNQQ